MRFFGYSTLITIFLAMLPALSSGNEYFLPEGYSVPKVEIPSPTPEDHLKFDNLEIVDRGRVRYLIQLDRSPMQWADELLNLRIGFSQHWSPHTLYALFPQGYEQDPGKASVFLSSLKLKFSHKFVTDSDEVMRAVNQPTYTMYRRENWIVVSKGDERRWYFESPDGGLSWRLGQMELIKHPDQFTRLEYEGDRVVSIVYPNQKQVKIKYEGDLPVLIETPFSESVIIGYGGGGYINQIDVTRHLESASPRKRKETDTYKFKCNASGLITEMITPSGEEYACEYQTVNAVVSGVKKRVDQTTIRRKRDNLFTARIDEFRVDKEWIVKVLRGNSKDDLSAAYPEYWGRLQMVAGQWQMSGYGQDSSNVEESFSSDKTGKQSMQIDADGAVTTTHVNEMGMPLTINDSRGTKLFEYNQLGQITRVITPEGNETTWLYDGNGHKLQENTYYDTIFKFEYDDRGFPTKCMVNNARYLFAFDEWGRMASFERPNGKTVQWKYDNQGRIIHEMISSSNDPDVEIVRSFTYDNGKLAVIQHKTTNNQQVERFVYDRLGELIQHIRADRSRVILQYDKLTGWLVTKSNPEDISEVWTYHGNGQIKKHRAWRGNMTLSTSERDAYGKIIYKQVYE